MRDLHPQALPNLALLGRHSGVVQYSWNVGIPYKTHIRCITGSSSTRATSSVATKMEQQIWLHVIPTTRALLIRTLELRTIHNYRLRLDVTAGNLTHDSTPLQLIACPSIADRTIPLYHNPNAVATHTPPNFFKSPRRDLNPHALSGNGS